MTPQPNKPALWQHLMPKPDATSNKYTRGSALVLGGATLTGAARLGALACARAGAGLTTIVCPQQVFTVYAASLLSVLVKPFSDIDVLGQLLADARISAYLIGPGAGTDRLTQHATMQILAAHKPAVLDADALTAFAAQPEMLLSLLHEKCVLTPHEGEFKRLFNLGESRVQSALQAAGKAKATIVLKGANTIIASPDGRCVINENAPATLATGGSGDVLAGILTGLLAQGMPPFEAACASVWIHTEAARLFGIGLIAEDLVEMLPTVLSALLE